MSISAKRFRIGYALAPKKVLSFIQPSLVDLAKQRGVDLVPIDVKTPLVEQGTFDCVIHKMYGEEWKKQLDEFSSNYPNAMVIDPLDAIERVHNRVSMLQVVNELEIDQGNETFGIPKQILIHSEESLSDQEVLEQLSFPVIAKPLVADGSAKSHKMSLLFNTKGLKSLSVPVVLQEFVNHGGVIFKVYVAGNHVKCVKRRSLPDISEEKLKASESAEGLLSFSQISNLATQDKSDDSYATLIQETQRPPSSFVIHVANGLRKALRLHLFNFDMIRDKRVDNGYLVIDINYFPGYAKMPDYETVLTDFFLEVVHPKHDKNSLDESLEKSSACKE